MNYYESDLNITFNPNWRLKRFDTSRYFKWLSGLGLKGVDFIGIDEEHNLFLIEVKNYKKRAKSPVDPDVSDLVGDHPRLQDHFVQKIEDSCQLIEVIFKYMNKKWWYRLLFKFRNSIPKNVARNSANIFWLDAYKLIKFKPHKVNGILILELEKSYPEMDHLTLKNMPSNLKAYFKVSLKDKCGLVDIVNLQDWHSSFLF